MDQFPFRDAIEEAEKFLDHFRGVPELTERLRLLLKECKRTAPYLNGQELRGLIKAISAIDPNSEIGVLKRLKGLCEEALAV